MSRATADPNVLDPDNSETGIYGSAESESYEVRGENYLVDKVKFPSRPVRSTFFVLVPGAFESVPQPGLPP